MGVGGLWDVMGACGFTEKTYGAKKQKNETRSNNSLATVDKTPNETMTITMPQELIAAFAFNQAANVGEKVNLAFITAAFLEDDNILEDAVARGYVLEQEKYKGKNSAYNSVYRMVEYSRRSPNKSKLHWNLAATNDSIDNGGGITEDFSISKLQGKDCGGKGVLEVFMLTFDIKVKPSNSNPLEPNNQKPTPQHMKYKKRNRTFEN